MEALTENYRHRYASYLASTFHIGLDAARAEANYQLDMARPATPVVQGAARTPRKRAAVARR
jgi:hypothetical protein